MEIARVDYLPPELYFRYTVSRKDFLHACGKSFYNTTKTVVFRC